MGIIRLFKLCTISTKCSSNWIQVSLALHYNIGKGIYCRQGQRKIDCFSTLLQDLVQINLSTLSMER